MNFSAKHLIIGIVLLGGIGLFYFKTKHIGASENERFNRDLERIRRLDSTFNQDILKVRFRVLEDYDSFGEQIYEINEDLKDLRVMLGFVDGPDRDTMGRKIEELSQLWAEKGELLETFKSQNAVLKNSLRYFPLAGSELVKRFNATGDHQELETPFNELMRQVLVYSLGPNAEQEQEIRATLARIAEWCERHPQDAEVAIVGSLTAHVESILNRQPKVEALVKQLVSMPTAPRAEELVRLHETQFAQTVRSIELYRGFLYALCMMLLVGVVYSFYALRAANVHLESKNNELQTEVAERKKAELELEKAHQDLVKSSRLAGMAEVATGVLHNVGNVLNSVNVSANLIRDHLRQSKSSDLGRVTALLREHSDDLAVFITTDPKGRQVPAYLERLAEYLAHEQEVILTELRQFAENVDHIKEIVATQQSYAKVSGVSETIKVTDLVEDALRINAGSLARRDVQLLREYDPHLPEITVEKHKVLQILVNLIRNAKYACDESGRPDKRLTMRVTNGSHRVRIAIMDNGVGIPPENLVRIFAHGFTTKKEGHGFGLHSGALAARELGGVLQVHSDGPGKGATFTLELPIQPGEQIL